MIDKNQMLLCWEINTNERRNKNIVQCFIQNVLFSLVMCIVYYNNNQNNFESNLLNLFSFWFAMLYYLVDFEWK